MVDIKITARLSDDGRIVTITSSGSRWAEVFPADRIVGRLDLYRNLRDRKDGRYAQHYAGTVTELERVKKLIAVLAN
jgi:hypothetical protein